MANTPVTYSTEGKFVSKVEKALKALINNHHSTLKDANIAIVLASRQPEDKPCKLVSPGPYGRAQDIDLVFVCDDDLQNVKENIARAHIDQALASWEGTEKQGKEGESARRVYQRRKSIPLFPEVLERNGPVTDDWKSVKQAVEQMVLQLEEAA